MSAYTAIKATSIPLQNASQEAIDAIEARKGTEELVEIGPPRLRSVTRVQIDAEPARRALRCPGTRVDRSCPCDQFA